MLLPRASIEMQLRLCDSTSCYEAVAYWPSHSLSLPPSLYPYPLLPFSPSLLLSFNLALPIKAGGGGRGGAGVRVGAGVMGLRWEER